MSYYKAQHEVFIRAVVRHGDQHLAYRQAYPKASKESAYTAAIRLARQPHIKERIAVAMQQHAQQEKQRAQEREERKRRIAEEDTLQKRIWLARVVRGEVMKQRYMQFKGHTILLHETLNPFIILAAIELDTKYEYGTNPKIILDRQFARLYQRAMRPVGLCWLNRLQARTNDQPAEPLPIPLNNVTTRLISKSGKSEVQTEKNTQNALKKLTTERSELVSTTKNDIKKRTNSKQNPRPAIHTASNIPAVCNKIEGRVVSTSAALVTRAEVHPAHYIIVSDTAESRQVLRYAQNDNKGRHEQRRREELLSSRPIEKTL